MAQYHTEGGEPVDIDPATVNLIKAFQTGTGRTTDDLFAEAAELLKWQLMPSTKPAATKRKPKPGAAK